MKIDLITSHAQVQPESLVGKVALVIDVLRATTVMVTALEQGAEEIQCVATPEEALALKAKSPDLLLGGERKALKIEGFDFSNSPLEYQQLQGKSLVMTTSNGTQALLKASQADHVLVACLRNGRAAIREALSYGKDLVLINAGTNEAFSLDDFIAAGYLVHHIKTAETNVQSILLSDLARAAWLFYQAHDDITSALAGSLHYDRLAKLGLQEDLAFCLTKDATDLVPHCRGGLVKSSFQ